MKRFHLIQFGPVAVLALAALGLILSSPSPAAAKTRVGVGVGVAVGNYGVGTGSYLQLGYGRHSRSGTSWNVGLGFGGPAYYYSAPSYSWHGYRSHGYRRAPGYSHTSVSYSRYRHRGRSNSDWRVSYHAYNRPHYRYRPDYYVYSAPVYYEPVPAYGGSVAVPLSVQQARRPSMSDRIVRGGPVERNPVMKRVWVPGEYSTRTTGNAAQSASGGTGQRVWEPGHWEYMPDTN